MNGYWKNRIVSSKFYIGEIPHFRKHIKILKIAVTLILLFIVLRTAQIQLYKGKDFGNILNSTNISTYYTKAIRGEILDRNGVVLAKDYPSFSLYIPNRREFEYKNIAVLSDLTGKSAKRIRKILKVSTKNILIKRDLTREQVIQLELNRIDIKGIDIKVEPQRFYPMGNLYAHLIGYVSEVSRQNRESGYYQKYDYSGKTGIEKMFDKTLRGKDGIKKVAVNGMGEIIKTLENMPAKNGSSLILSVDSRLQKIVVESMRGKKGAVVIIRPDTGAILAMYSNPSYDPNQFVTGFTKVFWNKIKKNTDKPLINRAVKTYPPGSIFKVVTAAAALENHVINSTTKIFSPPQIKVANQVYHDWKKGGFGLINIHRAIASSSDVFFYKLGLMTGASKIRRMALKFGLDRNLFKLIGSQSGLIPSPAWKWRRFHKKWYAGNTISMAIGQGYVRISPLQAAVVTAVIANGGYFIKPHILIKKEIKRIKIIGNRTIKIIRSGMHDAVNSSIGTAFASRSNMIVIAGKTGTAQIIRTISRDKKNLHIPKKFIPDAWFISFAPYKHPKFAMAVFIENGGFGGAAAAPVAKRIYDQSVKAGII